MKKMRKEYIALLLLLLPLTATARNLSWKCLTNNAEWDTRCIFSTAVFNDRIWVLNGIGFNKAYHDIWSSNDGSNWECEVAVTPYPMGGSMSSVVYNDRIWIFGGEEGC